MNLTTIEIPVEEAKARLAEYDKSTAGRSRSPTRAMATTEARWSAPGCSPRDVAPPAFDCEHPDDGYQIECPICGALRTAAGTTRHAAGGAAS